MVEVIRAGIQTTFQDRGRYGYRNQGVPLSGAMDQFSAQLANQLLGNDADTPVMEFVMQGPKLHFHQAKNIVITGGAWDIWLNREKIEMNQLYAVPKGGVLNIKGAPRGRYGYLAVKGGWKQEKVLGSYSHYPNITTEPKIKKGAFLALNEQYVTLENQYAAVVRETALIEGEFLEAQKGPEFDCLSREQQSSLLEKKLSLSKDCNRMAFPLMHDIDIKAAEITTAAVQPGTVQLTPSGSIIVLMRDAQTTGGYSRILQLSPMAINQLAQKRKGDGVYFKLG